MKIGRCVWKLLNTFVFIFMIKIIIHHFTFTHLTFLFIINSFASNFHFEKRKNNAKCLIVMSIHTNFNKKPYKKGLKDINFSRSVICISWFIDVSNPPMVLILADSFFGHNTVICGVNDSSGVNKIPARWWRWHHVWRKVLLLRRQYSLDAWKTVLMTCTIGNYSARKLALKMLRQLAMELRW
jgi:hypothetical protein